MQYLPFLQGYPIAYMGENGFEAEIVRPYGYEPVSKSCTDCYNWQSKECSNVIGALYKKSLFALEYVYKSVNQEVMVTTTLKNSAGAKTHLFKT